jgi:hypothetical protein
MSDRQNDQPGESVDRSPAPPTGSEKPRREVLVTHLDSPPPSGKRRIHPRRPAPIVPTREQRSGEQSANDADADAEGSPRERPNRGF